MIVLVPRSITTHRAVANMDHPMQLLARITEAVTRRESIESAEPNIPPAKIYRVLQNERRRLIVEYMAEMEGCECDAAELANHLESLGEKRQHAYISLIQQHLPTLDQYNCVAYDSDRKTVETKQSLETVYRAHTAVREELD
jgi:hypothetical protein